MTKKTNQDLEVRLIKDSLIFQYMPNPSNILTGNGLKVYDDMLKDGRIGSLFDDRVNATQNLPMHVRPCEDKRINQYVETYLSEKILRKHANNLLTRALTYGFAPAEIVWQQDKNGLSYIDALINHDIAKYRFDSDGNMYYDSNFQALNQPYKWIVHRHNGDRYNAPYGQAYLERAYWAWRFKKMGWQFWMTAAEKFSVPSIVALFDQTDPTKAREIANDLARMLSQINSGSAGSFANIKNIQQLTMSGSVADFNTLINACDLQISYALTGQALANNVSETGTQALGTVQERTKQSTYENDARSLAYTMQRLVEMAIHVNFGEEAIVPEFTFETDDKASFQDILSVMDRGLPVSKSAIYSSYGIPKPDENIEDDSFVVNRGMPSAGLEDFDFADDGKKKLPRLGVTIVKTRF